MKYVQSNPLVCQALSVSGVCKLNAHRGGHISFMYLCRRVERLPRLPRPCDEHGEEGEAEGGEEADPAADVTRVVGVYGCGTKERDNRGE